PTVQPRENGQQDPTFPTLLTPLARAGQVTVAMAGSCVNSSHAPGRRYWKQASRVVVLLCFTSCHPSLVFTVAYVSGLPSAPTLNVTTGRPLIMRASATR